MREIVFHLQEHSGTRLRASAEHPLLTIEAGTLEELQHEAREALIEHVGAAHCAYRVRVRRHQRQSLSAIRPGRSAAARMASGPLPR